jgi:hypothetical protein
MSPIMMGLLALLAYKAFKGRGGAAGAGQPAAPCRPGTLPPGSGSPSGGLGDILGGLLGKGTGGAPGAKPGGSLADMLPGGLGGLLGGAAAGSVLSGGLGNLVKEVTATPRNPGSAPVRTTRLRPATSSMRSGATQSRQLLRIPAFLGRSELLAGLSDHLPELIDQLTPHGRLPTEQEAARLI